jgi:hypothetical protein
MGSDFLKIEDTRLVSSSPSAHDRSAGKHNIQGGSYADIHGIDELD